MTVHRTLIFGLYIMVHIEKISVEGFKGHQDIELPTERINIITGKNNVGKTSILESIDLCFHPNNIRNYNGNVDKLINVNHETANIACEYEYKGKTRTLDQSSSQKEHTIKIHETKSQEKYEILLELLTKQVDDISLEKNNDNVDSFGVSLESILTRSIEDILQRTYSNGDLDAYIDSAVIIERLRDKVPFIYLSDSFTELIKNIAGDFAQKVVEDVSKEIKETELIWTAEEKLRGLTMGRYGRGNFIGEVSDTSGVNFINTFDITKKDIQSEEEYSVILTRIEDDLRSHYHIDNLYDFSLDNLVFEEGNNRYQLPYEFMGDGFKSIVGLLWELKTTDHDHVLLLEEPENHMHPGYINTLVGFLIEVSMEENIQLFITTHNIDFIESFINFESEKFENFLQDKFQIIQMQKYASQLFGISEARNQLKELHLDLRGE